MTRLVLAGAAAALLMCAGSAAAQQPRRPAPRPQGPPRFEISAGGMLAGGHDFGQTSADIVRNQVGGGGYQMFKAETRMDSASALESRLGWKLTPRFTVEGGVFLSRPQLVARLSGDVEGAPDLTAVEDLSLYIFEGAINIALGDPRRGRITPFARLGVGYVRQLHEDNLLVETGQAYHAGGGVTTWFGQGRRAGLRLDARIYFLQGGVDLGTSSRNMAAGGGAFVFVF